ncbi:glycoside hydrolase family 3 C-terminal domain-containing protein [Streptomyces sp. NBC_01267]|uniref:beta-glucosidase family protein n=1 Tax=Streptomyces sp. NBC_01267 TaxID=2903805 RepID=UPI002E37545D|nr:glycoside hydrolase family 3 C-terminal domain-containing protein [Streptomyces sp. NBC_01267]
MQHNEAVEARIEELLTGLDLEGKVRLLTGEGMWSTHPEAAVGLRRMVLSDGPAGVRGEAWDERDTSANLPSPTAVAATWDEELVHRLGALLAAEARRKGVDVLLGPTVNLHRSPLGGRHFECFSEDPLLTARIGAAYVNGVQEHGVAATPKHFVGNDSETERMTVDVQVDERTLRELYLAPFEQIVADAGPWLVMASYNAVNGPTMTENPLIDDVLKAEWGFDGAVVSDWTAVRSTDAAGAAGNDLAMPGPAGPWGDALVTAVREGRVPQSAIDEKVRRLLRLAARVGALDGFAPAAPAPAPVADQDIAALLREAAAAGTVLLRNDAGTLPLNPGALRRVAVIGPNAAHARIQGGGSATVNAPYAISPLQGLTDALSAHGVEVVHTPGAYATTTMAPFTTDQVVDPVSGLPGVRARLLDADGAELLSEHRTSGRLVYLGVPALEHTATVEVTARLRAEEAGVHRIGLAGAGSMRLEIDGEVRIDETVTLESGDPVEAFLNPPQRYTEMHLEAGQEVAYRLVHTVVSNALGAVILTAALRTPRRDSAAELDHAVELAASADAVVLVLGTNEQVESEGYDRTTLALPEGQDELAARILAVAPTTVVAINSGGPVLMPWADRAPAVLLNWFPGQEYGNALADVLLGHREPGGRLPTTWAARQEDVPVIDVTPADGVLRYGEGLHIGHRAWLRSGAEPAFWFGHGLGYTTWSYDSLAVHQGADGSCELLVEVTNTGTRPGREVVQAYLGRPESAVERPVQWFAGFAAATAQPGESVRVRIALPARVFAHWDVEAHAWQVEPGTFDVQVGSSAAVAALRAEVRPQA